jgi:hypothetical protein
VLRAVAHLRVESEKHRKAVEDYQTLRKKDLFFNQLPPTRPRFDTTDVVQLRHYLTGPANVRILVTPISEKSYALGPLSALVVDRPLASLGPLPVLTPERQQVAADLDGDDSDDTANLKRAESYFNPSESRGDSPSSPGVDRYDGNQGLKRATDSGSDSGEESDSDSRPAKSSLKPAGIISKVSDDIYAPVLSDPSDSKAESKKASAAEKAAKEIVKGSDSKAESKKASAAEKAAKDIVKGGQGNRERLRTQQ